VRFYHEGARLTEVPKKSGGTKAPTIREAIELGAVPSVTEVLNLIAKPFLFTWVEDKAFQFAWDSAATPIPYEDAKELYKSQSKAAMDKGSELHDKMSRLEPDEFTQEAVAWVNERYKITEHEIQFSSDTYGGTIDLIGKNDDGSVDIIDFKFVMSDRKPRDQELWQLAAYRAWVQETRSVRKCINLLISQDDGHIISAHEWTEEELNHGYFIFQSILAAWGAINNYDLVNKRKYHG